MTTFQFVPQKDKLYRWASIPGLDGSLDSIGAMVINGLCFREGKEAFGKAKAESFACTCGGSCKEGNPGQQRVSRP